MMFDLKLNGTIKLIYDPQASFILEKDYWYLDEDIHIELRSGNKKLEFTILRGFLTDGTSVSKLLHALIPVWDKNTSGVVIHDWLCNNPVVIINGSLTELAREDVDKIFLNVMKLNGVSKIRRTLMYAGVRAYVLFGIKKDRNLLVRKQSLEEEIRKRLNGCSSKCKCA